jgi:TolB-like protein/tetratricopeptide (TPR) repeat protein
MDPSLRRGFRIGVYHVEPLAGRITGPDGSQHVQPKVMDVLVFLAQHAGELVERDTLLEQIWRRVTSEEVLTRCISELRRALGDERGSPAYIQTVPKRGYRLVEPVVLIADPAATSVLPAPAPAEQAPVAATPPRPASAIASVAVLPFDTHSPDPALVHIGDAFAAELQNTLTRVDRLRVAARRSSFALKQANADIREIGERLNVDYVISGSIQSNGPNLRVFAELNETIGGTQVWAQSYDRSSADLLAVEKDVAGAIVASFTTQTLRAEIHTARQKSTSNLDAWGLVQKARSLALDYTAAGLAEAIRPLERAIELDPDYAAAHATLGSLLIEWLVNGLSTNAEHDEKVARDSAERALALAPQDPFILKMVSLVYTYAGDQPKAIACLRKAVVYAPFDFGAWGYMGWPLAATGDPKDLRDLQEILDRLLTTEPQHPGVPFWLYHKSVADSCEGNYEAALQSAQSAVELRPSLALAWMHYANVLGQQGAKDGARQAVERCSKVNPALTPKHYEALIKKIAGNDEVLKHRLGGLKSAGVLRR